MEKNSVQVERGKSGSRKQINKQKKITHLPKYGGLMPLKMP